jgi:hypothetical protein
MDEPSPQKPPLQFRLRSLLAITASVGLLFALLRWLDVPARASLIVLAVLAVSVAAAVGLVVAIAHTVNDGRDER